MEAQWEPAFSSAALACLPVLWAALALYRGSGSPQPQRLSRVGLALRACIRFAVWAAIAVTVYGRLADNEKLWKTGAVLALLLFTLDVGLVLADAWMRRRQAVREAGAVLERLGIVRAPGRAKRRPESGADGDG